MIAVAVALACAPAAVTPGGSAPRRSTFLTAAEIRDANLDLGSAFDAISRLRPNWLSHVTESNNPPRREFARVFVDGRFYGELESLRNIDASQIAEVRFYSAAESARFGLEGGLSGVNEINIKR
jgi:hypothetical protein